MTDLVIGGAGFIGSALVRELLEDGRKVVVYDNFQVGSQRNLQEIKDDIDIVIGDVLDEWKLIETFRKFKPDYVWNLAVDSFIPTAYVLPKRFLRINAEGTLNVLMAVKHFTYVSGLLHVSTAEVFGGHVDLPIAESHPLNPLNTFSVTKVCADRLCYTFAIEHDDPVIIARVFNTYGPRETHPYVIPEIISQLHKHPDYVELGDIKARRDFTYVRDAAKGLIAVMYSDLPNGDVVNICSGKSYMVKDLVGFIAEIMGIGYPMIRVNKQRLRKHEIHEFRGDFTKLKRSTGWEPTTDIKTGLRLTVDWFRQNDCRWGWEDTLEGIMVGGW